jgi:hypothetical protein
MSSSWKIRYKGVKVNIRSNCSFCRKPIFTYFTTIVEKKGVYYKICHDCEAIYVGYNKI